eukprot:5567136-Amphidinium_carterae.1
MSPALRRQNELMKKQVARLARRIQTNKKPMPAQTALQKMQWEHLIEWFEQHLDVRFLSLPVPASVHVNAQSLRGDTTKGSDGATKNGKWVKLMHQQLVFIVFETSGCQKSSKLRCETRHDC